MVPDVPLYTGSKYYGNAIVPYRCGVETPQQGVFLKRAKLNQADPFRCSLLLGVESGKFRLRGGSELFFSMSCTLLQLPNSPPRHVRKFFAQSFLGEPEISVSPTR